MFAVFCVFYIYLLWELKAFADLLPLLADKAAMCTNNIIRTRVDKLSSPCEMTVGRAENIITATVSLWAYNIMTLMINKHQRPTGVCVNFLSKYRKKKSYVHVRGLFAEA